jgi:hypothetical protein
VWNRSKWIKDPDTGKRRQVQRPQDQWVIHTDESQRIVPQELWDKVKARQRRCAAEVGAKVAQGLRSAGGHGPRYLFSGLIKCEKCGSSFVMKDKYSYQCAGYVNGKICDNSYRVRRDLLEDRLLAGIRTSLLTDESVNRFAAKIRRRMVERPVDPALQRRKGLEAEITNLVDAISTGLLSPALSKRLQDAERELDALPAPSQRGKRGRASEATTGSRRTLPAHGQGAGDGSDQRRARQGATARAARPDLGGAAGRLSGCQDGAGTPAPLGFFYSW